MAVESNLNQEIRKLLTTPEAVHLSELYVLKGDLDAAYNTLSLYFEKYPFDAAKSSEEKIIASALFRDGVSLYCSCFAKDDPVRLKPETVYGHAQDLMTHHEKLFDIRSSFVAHNFGPQRQQNTVAICVEIGGKLHPMGITQQYMRFSGWIAEEGKRLLPLIDTARDYLNNLIEEAEGPVLKAVTVISSEELAALPGPELLIPDHRDYRISRADFRKRGRGERVQASPRLSTQKPEDELDPHRSGQPLADPDEEAPPKEPEPTR